MIDFNTFSEYRYNRPDIGSLNQMIRQETAELKNAESADRSLEILNRVVGAWEHLQTLRQVCEIRNTIDTRDAFYESEMGFMYENIPLVKIELQKFQEAVLASPYLDHLKSVYGDLYFVRMEKLMKLVNEDNIPNQVEENKLIQLYHKTAASPIAEFHGEQLNFYGLLKKMEDPDRDIRKEAMTVWSRMYQSISDQLDDIYSKLIENRIKQAKVLGFKDYTEMMYLTMERFDYNHEDVALFREKIRQYITPLVSQIYEDQRQTLGIDKIHYYDENFADPTGNAAPTGTTQELLKAAQKMYHELSAETGQYFDFMMEHEMFDLETKPGKMQGGYCEVIPDVKAPFIFSNFNGTSADVDVLTHENGHGFEVFTAMRHGIPYEIAFATSEVAEIHSMAMEFLTYPWMDYFFPDCADKYRMMHLRSSLRVIPYMACVDEFQHEVYANAMTDADERCRLWHSLEEKYMPWRNYDGDEFLEKGGFWMQKQHIFMCPYYYIDYALSSMGAFEYYLSSLKDRDQTWSDYYRLCCAGGSRSYKELLKLGNLSDPFAEDTVRKLMEQLRPLVFNK